MSSPCCGPSADRGHGVALIDATTNIATDYDGMVLLSEGEFSMGSDDRLAYPADGEGPVRRINVSAFWMDRCAVTNEQFAHFVDVSGYVTEAERFGSSFVFAGLLPDDFPPTRAVARAPWWRQVEGADWRHPEVPGRTSTIARATLSCTSPGTTPAPSPTPPASGYPPRQSGNTRRAAV